MIGDLHQLPPVVRPEDWKLLRPHYETPYFFGSLVLQRTDMVAIELKHILRQSDDVSLICSKKFETTKSTAGCSKCSTVATGPASSQTWKIVTSR